MVAQELGIEEACPDLDAQIFDLVNGFYSGIPECCVMCYTSHQPLRAFMGTLQSLMYPGQKKGVYVQCPECVGSEPVRILSNGYFPRGESGRLGRLVVPRMFLNVQVAYRSS